MRHRAVSQNASFWFLSEVISFSGYSKERSQMSFLRFHRNSDFKLLNPKNDLTLWDEYKHHKRVAQKTSLQFSTEDICLLATGLQLPLNISSQNPKRQTFHTQKCRVSFNSMKWMHISESSFLECFFLNFFGRHFTFRHSLQCAPKASIQFSLEDVSFLTTSLWVPLNIPSQIPQRQSFQTGQCSGSFNSLKWMHSTESSFF